MSRDRHHVTLDDEDSAVDGLEREVFHGCDGNGGSVDGVETLGIGSEIVIKYAVAPIRPISRAARIVVPTALKISPGQRPAESQPAKPGVAQP